MRIQYLKDEYRISDSNNKTCTKENHKTICNGQLIEYFKISKQIKY